MKIRALTVGVSVPDLAGLPAAFKEAVALGNDLRRDLEAAGYVVQTVRVASNPFEEWLGGWASEAELQAKAGEIAAACEATGLEFVNVGPATTARGIRAIPHLLKAAPHISASAGFGGSSSSITGSDGNGGNGGGDEESWETVQEKLAAVVATMVDLARDPETKGLANFRFCAAFNCRPNTPFFPAAFHAPGGRAPMAVALGLENGDVVVEAFRGAKSLDDAAARLQATLAEQLVPLQALVGQLLEGRAGGVTYAGIDTSVNPTLDSSEHSLVRAYEAEAVLGEGRFGKSGTLAVSAALTKAVQGVPGVKTAGYSGLMLPVMEDHGLAERASEGPPAYGIADLITYSSVCGVGLDTVPVALQQVEEHPERVQALLMDILALSQKLNRKPLSCRLFPVPGGKVGDTTAFESPYLCNTRIFAIP